MNPRKFNLEVNPKIPDKLDRLEELTNNLWYSWHRPARALFGPLNPNLWKRVGHKPKLFLRSIDEKSLESVTSDQVFMAAYNQVLSAYDTYHKETGSTTRTELAKDDLVAYFCAEYGFHESFPIYSGGLGILAGDHCKTASDMRLPFVGVGLLYRQGYFTQNIDADGNQHAIYFDSEMNDLPVSPALDAGGEPLFVSVEFPGREVRLKVWVARVGHVRLYLLDSNLPENSDEDREITHQLYGGDRSTRIAQEMVLGLGGVRALRGLGLAPTVWHINEGHAAFLVVERVRELIGEGMDFREAMELAASNTVFTTHTPVPAGHDFFNEDLVRQYLGGFVARLGIDVEEFLDLARRPGGSPDFNMTNLAITGSRFQNGVSRLHGETSAHICQDSWPEIPPEENPIGHVTNGVHVPTFLAQAWSDLFDRFLGARWRNHLSDQGFWKRVDEIPDALFWSVNQSIKAQLLYAIRESLTFQHLRNQVSEVHLERMFRNLDPSDPNVLTIGFARRFATYKRSTLLFNNIDWLRVLLADEERPVVFIFAGKAHPADGPGQDMLRHIHHITNMPEFVGRILLVEGYDLALARRLVSGVDVWLNTPQFPLEASGTSGMKAAINGTQNLSILDGWWAEGYDRDNGWGVKPSSHSEDDAKRDHEDARTLYEMLQDEVIPLYYERGKHGYSPAWVARCKRSMATILPRFNMNRVIDDYTERLYAPAARNGRRLSENRATPSRELAHWKQRVRKAWPQVSIRRVDEAEQRICFGDQVDLEVAVQLDGLQPGDVMVELLVSRYADTDLSVMGGGFTTGDTQLNPGVREDQESTAAEKFLAAERPSATGEWHFSLGLQPQWCGKLNYRIRVFPYHPLLAHAHHMGLMKWVS